MNRCKLLCWREFLFIVLDLVDVDTSDHRPELLRRLEDWNWPSGHFDRRTGPGISRHPRLAMSDLEGAEAPNFNILLRLQRFLDRVEECVDHTCAIFLRDHRTRRPRNLGGNS